MTCYYRLLAFGSGRGHLHHRKWARSYADDVGTLSGLVYQRSNGKSDLGRTMLLVKMLSVMSASEYLHTTAMFMYLPVRDNRCRGEGANT